MADRATGYLGSFAGVTNAKPVGMRWCRCEGRWVVGEERTTKKCRRKKERKGKKDREKEENGRKRNRRK